MPAQGSISMLLTHLRVVGARAALRPHVGTAGLGARGAAQPPTHLNCLLHGRTDVCKQVLLLPTVLLQLMLQLSYPVHGARYFRLSHLCTALVLKQSVCENRPIVEIVCQITGSGRRL